MLELDRRTDRILPNGYCLLPPRQLCGKGNACLTCDKFATDATFLPELQTQLARTDQLITERRQAFKTRTGQDDERGQRVARRASPGTRRARPYHPHPRRHPPRRPHCPGLGAGVDARTYAITDKQDTD